MHVINGVRAMAFGDISDRGAVLSAVAEYDRLGENAFWKPMGTVPRADICSL